MAKAASISLTGAGVEDLDLQPHGASRRLPRLARGLGDRRVGGINEHGNANSPGHQVAQELQPLCHQLSREKIDTRHVAARPGEARDQTELDRVVGDAEDDRDRRGRRLGRERRRRAAR